MPVHFATDRECLEQALTTVGFVEPAKAKVLRIRDTLHLGEVLVSEAYAREAEARADLSVLEKPADMSFDERNDLLEW